MYHKTVLGVTESFILVLCSFGMCRWEDLAVGAPEFFVKDGLVGGAVYIYINNKGKNWDKIVPTQLLGPKESMFGLAVENIGDINQDGFGGCYIIISNRSGTDHMIE